MVTLIGLSSRRPSEGPRLVYTLYSSLRVPCRENVSPRCPNVIITFTVSIASSLGSCQE